MIIRTASSEKKMVDGHEVTIVRQEQMSYQGEWHHWNYLAIFEGHTLAMFHGYPCASDISDYLQDYLAEQNKTVDKLRKNL